MPQPKSLDFRLVQRICDLQQALDQALDSLEELQTKVAAQYLVETQLIETEHFANAQQQVITHLQTQLQQKHQWQEQLLQAFVSRAEQWMAEQLEQLERLKLRTQQGEAEIQNYLVRLKKHCQSDSFTTVLTQQPRIELESEIFVARMLTVSLGTQLQAIHQHSQALETLFNHYRAALAQLAGSLIPLDEDLRPTDAEAHNAAMVLTQSQNAQENAVRFELFHELKLKQRRIDLLQTELAQQMHSQTQMKHQCQAIAAERDHYQQQLQAAEVQVTLLQEQILQQASQAGEYEVKVQYWKEQSRRDRPRLQPVPKSNGSA
ncbi:hypothetical protein [Almyronema epifaneia]|uniref:Gas vesicle protein GvpC n=1 Tax=Almyronema epifaneia S1 TaxID=2991925 RepID=A0ABW6IHB9_9CYAN